MSVLDKQICLCLNRNWMPIGVRTVREAILAMNADSHDDAGAYVGLDIQYNLLPDGSYDFAEPSAMIPTRWAEWTQLPVREFDEELHLVKMTIRVPNVVIAVNYANMPQKSFRPSKKTIYERDKGKCQYTGRPLSFREATLDHVHPHSKGGEDSFENLVLAAPEVNHAKGNRSNKEAGLKLLKTPQAPLPIPAVALITEARHRDWRWFLAKNK